MFLSTFSIIIAYSEFIAEIMETITRTNVFGVISSISNSTRNKNQTKQIILAAECPTTLKLRDLWLLPKRILI